MPRPGLQAFAVDQFSGLNIAADPLDAGLATAVDMLNVDLDRQGRIRQRDGYTAFSAAATTYDRVSLHPFYVLAGTAQLVVCDSDGSTNTTVRALDTSGVAAASTLTRSGPVFQNAYARYGGTGGQYLYIGSNSGTGERVGRWDGTTFTTPGTMPSAVFCAIQATDNRLITANQTGTVYGAYPSMVAFSDAGAPETWGANNYVQLTPGDGEQISAMVAWRELVFVFKETKFFVFFGTSTDGSGNPVFNYRPVYAGVGTPFGFGGACAGKDGVYFLDRTGVYVTTGGPPKRVSGALDPWFKGTATTSSFSGSNLSVADFSKCCLTYARDRVWLTAPIGGSDRRTFVLDPVTGQWMYHDIGARVIGEFRISNTPELVLGITTRVHRMSGSYSTDNGTNISSFYESGHGDLGAPGLEKTVRMTELFGTGTVSFGWARNGAAAVDSQSVATVTFTGSASILRGMHLNADYGETLAFRAAGVSGAAWSLHSVRPMVRESRAAMTA